MDGLYFVVAASPYETLHSDYMSGLASPASIDHCHKSAEPDRADFDVSTHPSGPSNLHTSTFIGRTDSDFYGDTSETAIVISTPGTRRVESSAVDRSNSIFNPDLPDSDVPKYPPGSSSRPGSTAVDRINSEFNPDFADSDVPEVRPGGLSVVHDESTAFGQPGSQITSRPSAAGNEVATVPTSRCSERANDEPSEYRPRNVGVSDSAPSLPRPDSTVDRADGTSLRWSRSDVHP